MSRLGHQKFQRELAHLGLGKSVLVPDAARDLFDGARYALGLIDDHRDSMPFEYGASGSLRQMAEYVLIANGQDPRASDTPAVYRALGTNDFPALLTAIGSALIQDAYGSVGLAHRSFAKRIRARNYKPQRVAVLSSGRALERVAEGGAIQYRGVVGLETADLAVDRFSEIVSLSRQTLVNDEIGLLRELVRQSGIRAAETERKVVWDMILSNPGNFFHSDHGNSSSAASGATVSATTLKLARSSMRSQVAPDGSQVASRIAYIVAGPATEDAWEAFLATRWMPGSDDPAALKPPTVLIEPRIADQSWYGFADYRLGACAIHYAYLDGADRGLSVDQHKEFDSDIVNIKTSLDFGATCVDYRGAFRLAQSS